jgi:hypothetical protein
MTFDLYALTLEFQAMDSIYFPTGKPGNVIRGAFGNAFKRAVCVPECEDARSCQFRDTCAYARVFEPRLESGPSGFADAPRPFVFRARHLDGRTIAPGARFHFNLHVFDGTARFVPYFVLAFSELARTGLGPRRGRARLTGVTQSGDTVFDGRAMAAQLPPPLRLDLDPKNDATARVRLVFLSPTEFKHEHHLLGRPEFGPLFRRVRDRISTLRALYGEGPLDIDFRHLGARADTIGIAECDVRHVDVERRSSRTKQVHPLGGFTGWAVYEGDLSPYMPYLRAAQWTGVGRQTVWGSGEISVEPLSYARLTGDPVLNVSR